MCETLRPWPGTAAPDDDAGGSGSSDLDSAADGASRRAATPRCHRCGTPTNLYNLMAVFDGHNGSSAARQAGARLALVVEELLPWGAPPDESAPSYTQWRGAVQRALVEAIARIDLEFAERGTPAGCTATIVLQASAHSDLTLCGAARARPP